MSVHTVCVFCGAKSGKKAEMVRLASDVGRLIAQEKISIVYGGSNNGLMGAVTVGALAEQGRVIGVFPDLLNGNESPHMGLTDLIRTPCLATRKQKMVDISDVFLILPGGYGTLDEIFEIVTLYKLSAHEKPMILFNHDHFWDHMLKQIQLMVDEGFIDEKDGDPFYIVNTLEELQDRLRQLSAELVCAHETAL